MNRQHKESDRAHPYPRSTKKKESPSAVVCFGACLKFAKSGQAPGTIFTALSATVLALAAACGPRAGRSAEPADAHANIVEIPTTEPTAAPLVEPVSESVPASVSEPSPESVAKKESHVIVASGEQKTDIDYSFDEFYEDYSVDVPVGVVEEEMAAAVPLSARRDHRGYDRGESEGHGERRGGKIHGQRPDDAGVITAGEWNDLDNWDFWRDLLQRERYRYMSEYWGFDGIDRRPQQKVRPARYHRERRTVEVAFMVDATGSMSDELEFLKTELVDVVGRVEGSNPGTEVLTGAVFYRDQGDEYVTRLSPFTREVGRTSEFIKKQYAAGGGDFPEAVHTALKRTLSELQWSDGAHAKIVFMLLDAPPHHRPDVLESLHLSVDRAAENGIRIVPIVASGIDKETEFLMRFIAISTDGTYVFITNHSGVGASHLEPSVGRYRVELLNDLIVRLINKYAA